MESSEGHDFTTVSMLESFEEMTCYAETARWLSPCYKVLSDFQRSLDGIQEKSPERNKDSLAGIRSLTLSSDDTWRERSSSDNVDIFMALLDNGHQYQKLVDTLQEGDDGDNLVETLWSMPKNVNGQKQLSVGEGEDIFAIGCLIAELYLKRPLFDRTTASQYEAYGTVPRLVECLPPYVQFLVKSTMQKDLLRSVHQLKTKI
jgi:WD repeat-containing protein 81